MATKFYQTITAIDTKEQAIKIAKTLVEEKLASCVQIIGPITSIYKWKGKIEEENEFLLLIKTTSSCYKQLEKRIKEIHPYELPEIMAIEAVDFLEEFGKWIIENTKS